MSCDNVTIVTRQEWGARDSVTINNMTTPVSFVFIHHTAMSYCHNQHDCSQELRTIQNFHMDTRGWDDIGYNFLIGEDGRVYEARGWDRIGAHTYGWNDVAVAFSIMGNYKDRIPNDKALSALKNIINCGLSKGKITHNYKMYGHRDVRSTECPGNKLYELIETWDHFGHNKPVKPAKGSPPVTVET